MRTQNRILALILALVMALSCLPMTALAEEVTGTTSILWPVPGHTSLSRGYSSDHPAIDIMDGSINGATVIAATSGTVCIIHLCPQNHYYDEDSGKSCCNGFGTGLVIQSADGRYYQYAHMQAGSIPPGVYHGAYVEAGSVLGLVGSTGNSSGPHLHFSITERGYDWWKANINPYDLNIIYTGVETQIAWGEDQCSPSDTDAYIYTRATANVGGTFTQASVTVYQNGAAIGGKTENISTNSTYLEIWYNLTEELGLILTPGTAYTYQFSVVFNGTTFTSPMQSFTTTGTSPTQPEITWSNNTCQVEEINVQTSVRATSNVQGTFTQKGIILSSSIGRSPLTITEDINVTGSVLDIAYGTDNQQIKDYIFINTSYTYQFFVVFNGVQYTSPENSFRTSSKFPICGNWGPDDSDSVTYTLEEDGTLTFSGAGDMKDGPFTSVTGCDYAKRVVINEGITSVGQRLFSKYNGTRYKLESVSLPSTLKSIGEKAFDWCEKTLTGITLPEGLTTIGAKAFWDCDGLTSIKIPGSVTNMGNATFYSCTNLKEVTILPGLTSIPASAFALCENLQTVSIPDSVTSIGSLAFGKTALTSIVIPKNVASIEANAFGYCSALTEITFEGNAPALAENTFSGVTATAYYPLGDRTWTADVMQNYGGTITWVPNKSETQIPVPAKPYKITNVVSGVHVYWAAVNGVERYGLWRSETGKDGTYKWIANPTVPHFTDTSVVSGKTYYYKVTSMNAFAGEHSAKSEPIGIAYVSTPDIISRSNVAAGVELGWEKITGATGYAIYRKSYDGNDAWVRVGTIAGNSTFTWTDTSVKNNNGEIYRYTIRALAGSDMKTLSGCRNTGRTMVRLSSQVLKSAEKAGTTSIKCTWTTSSRVTGYEVRFMVGSTVYKTFTVGNWKTGVKTFTGLASGQTYTVQVRTYKKVDGVGSFYSDWSSAKTVSLK